jgi:hypothetical protein
MQTEARVEKRIDAAHLVGATPGPAPADTDASAPPLAPPRGDPERIRIQAEQLARHFEARQKDLDHRDAQVSARIAQLDRDTRTARLWLAERQSELQRRSEELAAGQREAQQRLARLAAAEAAQNKEANAGCDHARRQTKLAAQAQQLAEQAAAQEAAGRKFEAEQRQIEAALARERQQIDARRESSLQLIRQLLAGVERRRQAVEAEAARLQQRHPSPQLPPREEVLTQSSQTLDARGQQPQQAEARLAEAHAEMLRLQEELREDRRRVQEEGRRQQQRWAAEHRRALEELENKRQAVDRRGEYVDQCRLALHQLRSELGRMHRETLEIRLATEELWVQLSAAAPPAALTRSLGRIRSKLAEHYRFANAELQAQKAELEGIRGQLGEQLAKLSQQKRQFDQWAAVRQEEADKHAARLIAREQQLSAREAELQDRRHCWQAERLEYQHEIRRLQARLPKDASPSDGLGPAVARPKHAAPAPPTQTILNTLAGQRTAATLPA